MNITTKTTRAQLAAHIAEQASLIDAKDVTIAELRKERDAPQSVVDRLVLWGDDALRALDNAERGLKGSLKAVALAFIAGIVIGYIAKAVL
jgi:hypothetical protein